MYRCFYTGLRFFTFEAAVMKLKSVPQKIHLIVPNCLSKSAGPSQCGQLILPLVMNNFSMLIPLPDMFIILFT